MGAQVCGIALPPSTKPAHWSVLDLQGIQSRLIDIRDATALIDAVKLIRPEIIFHLAAQPLVRRSYRQPVETFSTNVTGLINVLEAARSCETIKVIVNATTDKVYRESSAGTRGYTEKDPLGGHDPYSTSKACAELISECYRRSYFDSDAGPSLATARSGNVIGGGDWGEDRLVPDLIRGASNGHPLRIRNPQATRPWQHVLEPLSGYLRAGEALLSGTAIGNAWNFGPPAGDSRTVGDVAASLNKIFPTVTIETDSGPHPHEAAHLALDCSKAARELAWHPVWDADKTLERTAQWYRAYLADGSVRTRDDLAAYVADARIAGLAWAT